MANEINKGSYLFSEGEQLKDCSFESLPKETTPPSRYKDSSFVMEMKKAGIGRPSTYDTTVKTIKSETRGYCIVENKYLKPTKLGIDNIDFLDQNFKDLINLNYTKEMEESLDLIAQGKLDYIKFLKQFFDHLEESVKKVVKEEKICPQCGKPLKLRKSFKGTPFYGCSNYPNCKYTESIKK